MKSEKHNLRKTLRRTLTTGLAAVAVSGLLSFGGCESGGGGGGEDVWRVYNNRTMEYLAGQDESSLNLKQGDGINDDKPYRDFLTEQDANNYLAAIGGHPSSTGSSGSGSGSSSSGSGSSSSGAGTSGTSGTSGSAGTTNWVEHD